MTNTQFEIPDQVENDGLGEACNNIGNIASEIEEAVIEFRRDIHQHPEIGFKEYETTKKVIAWFTSWAEKLQLTEEQVKVNRLQPTGLTVDLLPKTAISKKDSVLAIRADMDALPLQETTDLEFASLNDGITHACGHDIHTAALAGAGVILMKLLKAGKLDRKVRLIFQAAEEVVPGGAEVAIEQGVLENVTEIYALHTEPKLEVGKIGAITGALTSATDMVEVKLSGKGGHTSRPHLSSDLIQALTHIAFNAPGLVARQIDQRKTANLSWGSIHSGNTQNAIPATGSLLGTFRTLDLDVWEEAGEIITNIIMSLAEPFKISGLNVAVNYRKGVPPVINSVKAIDKFRHSATKLIDPDSTVSVERSLGAEDFAHYLEIVKEGAMIRLGTNTPGAIPFDIHQPNLVVDERAIMIGAKVFAGLLFE
jgi:amidohydrolase